MKSIFLFTVLAFCKLVCIGQGIDNLWMMGYASYAGIPFGGMNMNFESGSMVLTYSPRQMNFTTTSITHCDTSGNVLFYSNGVYIANANGDTMMNGSELSPCYYTDVVGWNGLFIPQAALAIPFPGHPSKFFLFHNSVDDSVAYCYRTYYSEIDMSLDNNLGAVTSKNNVLYADTLMYGHLTGVKHANGRDWWVVFHGGKNDKYIIYLVDPGGIHLHNIQRIGGTLYSRQGQNCFSPDGSKFALYDDLNDLHLLDFDRCAGTFDSVIHVAINDSTLGGGGVAFSSNSQVLYVSSTRYVYQFDMTAPDIALTQTTVAVWDTFYSPSPPAATVFYLAQLAPDNKIYISSQNGVLSMHVIEHPDSLGLACNVCQHCISLPSDNFTTMPNHPNYHLGALGSSICDSLPTGIADLIRGREEIDIFPNPVRDKLYIHYQTLRESASVTVYNSMIQQMNISALTLNQGEYVELNTSYLIPGVYFVEVRTKNGRVVRRFVKE